LKLGVVVVVVVGAAAAAAAAVFYLFFIYKFSTDIHGTEHQLHSSM